MGLPEIWEFAIIRGPNIDSKTVELLLHGRPEEGPIVGKNSPTLTVAGAAHTSFKDTWGLSASGDNEASCVIVQYESL